MGASSMWPAARTAACTSSRAHQARPRAAPGQDDPQDQSRRSGPDRADRARRRRSGRSVRAGRALRLGLRRVARGRAHHHHPAVEERGGASRRAVVGGGRRGRPGLPVGPQERGRAEVPVRVRRRPLALVSGAALLLVLAFALSPAPAQEEEDLTASLKTMRASFNKARERLDNLDFAGAIRELSTVIEPRKTVKGSDLSAEELKLLCASYDLRARGQFNLGNVKG